MNSKIPSPKKLPHGILSILDPRRQHSLHIDVQATWKKFGWVSPQEQKVAKMRKHFNE